MRKTEEAEKESNADEQWAKKLYDVYEEESGKIMDIYMESAQ